MSAPDPNIQRQNGDDTFWWRLTHMEPTVYRSLVVAVVALLVSLGVKVSPGLPDAIIGFIGVLALITQVLWVREGVMPTAKVVTYLPDPVAAPAEIRAGEAVTTAKPYDIVEAARVSGP